jgi:hypothetical protein
VINEYSVRDISFLAPKGWKVREVDDVIEVQPSDNPGALHISFLQRTIDSPPNEDDAYSLLASFARNSDLVSGDDLTATASVDEARICGRFHPRCENKETPAIWILASVVWPDRALEISYCTDKLDMRTRTAVMDLIASIRSDR